MLSDKSKSCHCTRLQIWQFDCSYEIKVVNFEVKFATCLLRMPNLGNHNQYNNGDQIYQLQASQIGRIEMIYNEMRFSSKT